MKKKKLVRKITPFANVMLFLEQKTHIVKFRGFVCNCIV